MLNEDPNFTNAVVSKFVNFITVSLYPVLILSTTHGRTTERAERAHLLPSVRVPQTSEYHTGQMIRWPCRGSHATPSKINQELVIRQVRNAAKTRRPTGQSVSQGREGNIWLLSLHPKKVVRRNISWDLAAVAGTLG